MANILLSCWEYSRYHKQVLPVTGFWQFDRIVDSKVGFNPPFHCISRGPLDRSDSCSVEQATFYHTREARLVILAIITVIQSEILVVVTGWKDVILNE